ncbi:unnamed protein product [Citrullus colocynthis]|uniref:Uncharacterized protein n=1 Tax=Citrullus colocynthis TaxID=252529 RepID=A0ABP0YKA0_9ROSI
MCMPTGRPYLSVGRTLTSCATPVRVVRCPPNNIHQRTGLSAPLSACPSRAIGAHRPLSSLNPLAKGLVRLTPNLPSTPTSQCRAFRLHMSTGAPLGPRASRVINCQSSPGAPLALLEHL